MHAETEKWLRCWRLVALIVSALLLITAGMAEAGSTSRVVTVPIVGVFHQPSVSHGEVLPALFIQVERRDDNEPLRAVLIHRAGMVDANYAERLETALRNGLARLSYDTRGLTVTVGFSRLFRYTGGSLSAAVVIGAVAALEDRSLAPNLVLTGTVESDGSIGPIADLQLKIDAAGPYTVLYPSSQTSAAVRQLASLPVTSLQEARALMLR
jgi:hypothetical protein